MDKQEFLDGLMSMFHCELEAESDDTVHFEPRVIKHVIEQNSERDTVLRVELVDNSRFEISVKKYDG
jgi:hypothetical protein